MSTKRAKGKDHVFRPRTRKRIRSAEKRNDKIKRMPGFGEKSRPMTIPLAKPDKR